MPLIILLSFL